MGCSKCGRPGVIFQEYSGLHLCKQHFKEDLLHKAKKTVRQNQWLVPGERYAVGLSGRPVSCALMDFMHTLVGERKDISLIAVTIKDTNPVSMENAKAITEAFGISWFTIPEGDTEEIQPGNRCAPPNQSAFPVHAFIESRLRQMRELLKIDTLVMGYTLEDHAEWVLWNAIFGKNIQKPGYAAENKQHVRVIRPLMHIHKAELDLYTRLFLDKFYLEAQPDEKDRWRDPVNTALSRLSYRHPGIPYALVNIGDQIKKLRDRTS